MWFAWKYLPLWYQQQRLAISVTLRKCCDLLENIYLCGINNNWQVFLTWIWNVVICLKISTFVVSTTTHINTPCSFAGCDLLENIYLCGINNNRGRWTSLRGLVVICLKISTFVVSTTTCDVFITYTVWLWFAWKYLPLWYQQQLILCNLLFIKRI